LYTASRCNLTLAIAAINTWNCLSIDFRAVPGAFFCGGGFLLHAPLVGGGGFAAGEGLALSPAAGVAPVGEPLSVLVDHGHLLDTALDFAPVFRPVAASRANPL
jgi:hypothetical protein